MSFVSAGKPADELVLKRSEIFLFWYADEFEGRRHFWSQRGVHPRQCHCQIGPVDSRVCVPVLVIFPEPSLRV
ncbi:hypothetical protein [Bradyrhizobium sp. LTSPM299]|uniref:hypothetical protein n=1 Tax=Bradyrhizobium sp. LTSPM299 TaxID=1619233 RepID=UPI0018CC7C86|nr:hypothetical protein [Bradyrhizobium sp. LTSPM299]